MLRALEPDDRPAWAYRVPWHVDRSDALHPIVLNAGPEPLGFVRLLIHGSGASTTQYWGQLLPAERIDVCLCGIAIDDLIVTVAWFRQGTGEEYCWRLVV